MQEPNSLQIGTAREILDDTIPGGSKIVYWNGEFWTPILRIGLRRSIPDASEPNGHRLEYWTGKQWTNRLIHGAKIALYPTPEQAAKFKRWQRRVRSLWNLLLDIEKAAYSGEPFRPELHWRPIWAEVVQKNHEIALKDWTYGKKVRMGKNKGMEIPAKIGEPPVPPKAEFLKKAAGARLLAKFQNRRKRSRRNFEPRSRGTLPQPQISAKFGTNGLNPGLPQ